MKLTVQMFGRSYLTTAGYVVLSVGTAVGGLALAALMLWLVSP